MDYHLKPIGTTCSSTGKDLRPGMRCHSALVEQNDQFIRLDYSEEGWNGPPDGTIGHWDTVVPKTTETKSRPLDPNALMRYFEQLNEDLNPGQEKFRYILALLLLQKRKLKIQNSRQDGEAEFLEVIGSQGEGPYEIRQQALSDDEIAQLQQELSTHLIAEWN